MTDVREAGLKKKSGGDDRFFISILQGIVQNNLQALYFECHLNY